MINLRQPGSDNSGSTHPTAEDLDEGSRYATGGWITTGFLYDPETECEVIIPKNVGHGILFKPEPMESRTFTGSSEWEPMYPLHTHSVSQTFQLSTKSFRQFHKILGIYRLPGVKPLIHKGKKKR